MLQLGNILSKKVKYFAIIADATSDSFDKEQKALITAYIKFSEMEFSIEDNIFTANYTLPYFYCKIQYNYIPRLLYFHLNRIGLVDSPFVHLGKNGF